MRKTLQRTIIMTLMIISGFSLMAQDKIQVDFGTDLMSRYVWRGTQFGGNSPSIQPALTANYKGIELGAWGAYSISGANAGQELDIYASVNLYKEMFTLTVTDYFFPNEAVANDGYFDWDQDNTGHILEGALSFNGTDKIPFSLMAAVNFYGADAKKLVDDANSVDFNTEDGIIYSTYIELGYAFEAKETEFNVFCGATLSAPKEADETTGFIGEAGFYGEKAGLVNVGITGAKEIKITDSFSLPVSTSLIANPQTEKLFFVLGISL